ncbi:MAG: hypothetical protein QW727_03690 [Candidatus Pacearchaeota archaeon]
MEKQEYLIKLQMLEQQVAQFSEQLKAIDQQIFELNFLNKNMSILDSIKEKDMFAEIGKGIYIKTKLEKKEMLVDVGQKILVPKNIKEIQLIINNQIKKFNKVKDEIAINIDKINSEVDNLVKKTKNDMDSNKKDKRKN